MNIELINKFGINIQEMIKVTPNYMSCNNDVIGKQIQSEMRNLRDQIFKELCCDMKSKEVIVIKILYSKVHRMLMDGNKNLEEKIGFYNAKDIVDFKITEL